MSDPIASKIIISCFGLFIMKASVRWQHGDHWDESDDTDTFGAYHSREIDLTPYWEIGRTSPGNIRLSEGDTCWLRVQITLGRDVESNENVTFGFEDQMIPRYVVSGTTQFPEIRRGW